MHYSNRAKDVQWFYPRILSAEIRHCCPTCGHIIGGRMKWDYPPIAELPEDSGGETKIVYVGTVLAECPDCKSYFTQQEVTSYDRESVETYISKARPAETKTG